jgi:hypothetical protein
MKTSTSRQLAPAVRPLHNHLLPRWQGLPDGLCTKGSRQQQVGGAGPHTACVPRVPLTLHTPDLQHCYGHPLQGRRNLGEYEIYSAPGIPPPCIHTSSNTSSSWSGSPPIAHAARSACVPSCTSTSIVAHMQLGMHHGPRVIANQDGHCTGCCRLWRSWWCLSCWWRAATAGCSMWTGMWAW